MECDPISETFPPGRKLPIRAPLQGSVPPFGSAVVQRMFIPSVLIHTLLGNQGLCPRRSTRPPLRPTQKWPPSLSASSPARPKPQNHGPSPSPTSPIVGLAECFALPVATVEVCRVQPEAYSRGLGRYDVHFYTGTDQEDEFDSHPSTSPPPKKRIAPRSQQMVLGSRS